jgi:hypothetical protein
VIQLLIKEKLCRANCAVKFLKLYHRELKKWTEIVGVKN